MGKYIDDLQSLAAGDREWYLPLRELGAAEIEEGLRSGTVVNSWDGAGKPSAIPHEEEFSGAFLETPVPTARVDAAVLAGVLRSFSGGEGADSRGLRLHQVVIVGTMHLYGRDGLDLNGLTAPFALGFTGCVFVGGISATRSHIRRMSFDTCAFVEARTGIVLHDSRIDDGVTFFMVEGLTQFMAPDAYLGELRLRADAIELPEDPAQFRSVLMGTTIGTLVVDGSNDSHEVLPAGSCEGLTVERISMWSDKDEHEKHLWQADWMAAWLSGGRRPAFPLLSWRETEPRPHARSAWDSIATAMSRAGYESPRGVRYVDQGTRLRLLGERHRDSKLGAVPRFVRWLALDVSTAYFSQNLRALGWLAVGWLVVAVLAWLNIHDLWRAGDAQAGLTAPEGPLEAGVDGVGWALTYGLDLVVSPLDLGFDAVWPTSIGLLSAFAVVKLVSLALFGLFVFGLTSVLERSSRRA